MSAYCAVLRDRVRRARPGSAVRRAAPPPG